MTTPQPNLYNTGGIPDFIEPNSLQEARERVSELRLAVMSINDQIAYQQAAGNVDPAWLRRSTTSRRFKLFEQERLENWIHQNSNLSERIIAVVRVDYSDADWDAVVEEARKNFI